MSVRAKVGLMRTVLLSTFVQPGPVKLAILQIQTSGLLLHRSHSRSHRNDRLRIREVTCDLEERIERLGSHDKHTAIVDTERNIILFHINSRLTRHWCRLSYRVYMSKIF